MSLPVCTWVPPRVHSIRELWPAGSLANPSRWAVGWRQWWGHRQEEGSSRAVALVQLPPDNSSFHAASSHQWPSLLDLVMPAPPVLLRGTAAPSIAHFWGPSPAPVKLLGSHLPWVTYFLYEVPSACTTYSGFCFPDWSLTQTYFKTYFSENENEFRKWIAFLIIKIIIQITCKQFLPIRNKRFRDHKKESNHSNKDLLKAQTMPVYVLGRQRRWTGPNPCHHRDDSLVDTLSMANYDVKH